MELGFGAEYDGFRAEVRSFLASHWPCADSSSPRKEQERQFRQKATEAGLLYRGVPRRYGGSEQSPDVVKAEIIREEFRKVRAPVEVRGAGTALLIPTLLEWGTEAQKERFIPPTVSGEYLWAQGYSEPGAGSDLASLRTSARLEGDQWIINGQKVWSTLAHKCQYMFALVRTEPQAPKREGISYLLLNLHQPGVTIKPLRQMTGHSEFCEVFFDDAKAPADWIVGKRGEGWKVSKSTLKHERSSISGLTWLESMFKSLVRFAKETDSEGRAAIQRDDFRERLAGIQAELMALTYSTYRSTSMAVRDQDPGIFSFMPKLYSTTLAERMVELARDMMADDFAIRNVHDHGRTDAAKWVERYMSTISMAIAGGTSNIQRNIIAERGLGMPRQEPVGGLL